MDHISRQGFVFVLLLILVSGPAAASTGGPDLWGYTWVDSAEPGGPAVVWVDITSLGTEIELGDETIAGPLAIGFSFPYYWSSYDTVRIGANGWLSFDHFGSLNHCFQSIPSPGGVENIIAPMMSDLTFTGPGNIARLYTYYDVANQRFIVSWHDVPFSTSVPGGWSGNNTFQVILSAIDGSITFQYFNTDAAAFVNTGPCLADAVVGIENITGNIGIEVLSDAVPGDFYAVKFVPPPSSLVVIKDVTPAWNQIPDNGGIFADAALGIDLVTNVLNAGNAAFTTTTSASVELLDLNLIQVYSDNATVPPLIALADHTFAFFPAQGISPGQYYMSTTTTHADDINPSNDQNSTEIGVLDLSSGTFNMTWATPNSPDSSVGHWAHGIYVVSPVFPVRIDEIQAWPVDLGGSTGEYRLQIFDDDGVNGAPGTLLSSTTVASGSYSTGDWVSTAIPTQPVILLSGFYVVWVPIDAGLGLGTQSGGPISQQSWSRRDRDWTTLANNELIDLLLGVTVTVVPAGTIFSDGFESGGLGAWPQATGAITYASIDAAGIAALNPQMNGTDIDGSLGNELYPGTWFVYKTDLGRYGKFIVDRYDYADVRISWVTYDIGGAVHSQGSKLLIRGTWYCELDEGNETGSPADWQWRQDTVTARALAPANGAVFKVMQRSLVP